MTEAFSNLETQERRTPETVVGELVTHFERVGHPISRQHLELLIDDIHVTDLGQDPLTDRIGRVPLAKLEGKTITFDQRFELLSPEQQRYVLAHEYSHSLNSFLASREDTRSYQRISSRVQNLGASHVSPYIEHLSTQFDQSPESQRFIQEEKLAETFAQFLSSDRTFTGFMTAKLLQFEVNDTAEESLIAANIEIEKIADLAAYLDIASDDEQREAFLDHHEGLRAQYELWKELTSLFSETDFNEIQEEAEAAWLEQLNWDDDQLDDGLHLETVTQGQIPRTAFAAEEPATEPRPPFSDLLTFWKLYP